VFFIIVKLGKSFFIYIYRYFLLTLIS